MGSIDMVTDKKMLNVQDTMLVVVDVQSRLVPAIAGADKVLRNIVRIIKGAHILSLPVLGVEQYPRGLGPTVPEIRSLFNEQPIEKISFAATDEEMFVERLKDCNRKQVLLCGMEAHVCVYQSALGLMDVGYEVHLLADAIGSGIRGTKALQFKGCYRKELRLVALKWPSLSCLEPQVLRPLNRFRSL